MCAFWNNLNMKPPVARKLAVRHTSFVCLTASFLANGGFLKLFHKIPWFFPWLFRVFSNSMIFPCMELFFLIFQVFHDFQSLWEHCWQIGSITVLNTLSSECNHLMAPAPWLLNHLDVWNKPLKDPEDLCYQDDHPPYYCHSHGWKF